MENYKKNNERKALEFSQFLDSLLDSLDGKPNAKAQKMLITESWKSWAAEICESANAMAAIGMPSIALVVGDTTDLGGQCVRAAITTWKPGQVKADRAAIERMILKLRDALDEIAEKNNIPAPFKEMALEIEELRSKLARANSQGEDRGNWKARAEKLMDDLDSEKESYAEISDLYKQLNIDHKRLIEKYEDLKNATPGDDSREELIAQYKILEGEAQDLRTQNKARQERINEQTDRIASLISEIEEQNKTIAFWKNEAHPGRQALKESEGHDGLNGNARIEGPDMSAHGQETPKMRRRNDGPEQTGPGV